MLYRELPWVLVDRDLPEAEEPTKRMAETENRAKKASGIQSNWALKDPQPQPPHASEPNRLFKLLKQN